MSKTCPNCGVNSPDNAKFCIECAHSLEDVPINKEEKPPQNSEDDKSSLALGCIMLVVIAAIIIVVVGFIFLGWGGGNTSQDNITITFGEVYAFDSTSNGKTYYNYYVNGYFDKMPKDIEKYMIKTKYCDSSGKELTSTSKRLSDFKNDVNHNYASTISTYQTQNYINVDHVCVQVLKDNQVVQEFNSTMNTNKLTKIPNSGNTSK